MTDNSVMYKIKEATTFLDVVDSFVGWKIIEKLLHRCLVKRRDASGKNIVSCFEDVQSNIVTILVQNLSDR